MTRINLIPWREMRRAEQAKRVTVASFAIWALMIGLVFYGHWYMVKMKENQDQRNNYLKQEIAKLDKEIEEIKNIRERKQELIARMEVIQGLQADRAQIVHLFDDLVRKLPKGVYFTGLQKTGKKVTLSGFAQSNARISSLMRDLDSSEWFANPDLDVINVTPRGQTRVSKFTLRVNQSAQIQQDGEEVDG